jgi:hypothetical protein
MGKAVLSAGSQSTTRKAALKRQRDSRLVERAISLLLQSLPRRKFYLQKVVISQDNPFG